MSFAKAPLRQIRIAENHSATPSAPLRFIGPALINEIIVAAAWASNWARLSNEGAR